MLIRRLSFCLGLLLAISVFGCSGQEQETYKMKEKGTATLETSDSNKQSLTINPDVEP